MTITERIYQVITYRETRPSISDPTALKFGVPDFVRPRGLFVKWNERCR